MADVREHRHRDTREALFRSAIESFAERGFAAVTVEEIAARAGVSRRTAYRRFRSKDDILLELPRRWLEVFDSAVAATTDGDPVETVFEASIAISTYIDAHRAETLVGLQALAEAPGLQSASVARDDWHRRVETLFVAGGRPRDVAAMLAGAYLGGIDSMLAVWAESDAERSLVDLNERLNEQFRRI